MVEPTDQELFELRFKEAYANEKTLFVYADITGPVVINDSIESRADMMEAVFNILLKDKAYPLTRLKKIGVATGDIINRLCNTEGFEPERLYRVYSCLAERVS